MKSIITKISLLVIFLLVLTGYRCQTYVEPCEFYIGVQNSSDMKFSALKFEYQMNENLQSTEWLLTEKQYGTGDVFKFPPSVYFDGGIKYRVQLIDKSGIAIADTTLQLSLGFEQQVTYMFKYKVDRTLELETIIKPL